MPLIRCNLEVAIGGLGNRYAIYQVLENRYAIYQVSYHIGIREILAQVFWPQVCSVGASYGLNES